MARKQSSHISDSSSALEALQDEADDITIQPVDKASFVARTVDAGDSYVERWGQHRAKEQPFAFDSEGEAAARPFRQVTEANRERAVDQQFLIDQHRPVVEALQATYLTMVSVIGPYARRSRKEKAFYYVRMALLMLADVVGISGGAIMLGELPVLAILQGLGAGVAAITSGLLGGEIKDARMARRRTRDPETLSDDERKYAAFFSGADSGEFLMKAMVYGGLSIAAWLGFAVVMLRLPTQGADAGIAFSFLAVAVALASWVNSYCYADEAADMIERVALDAQHSGEHLLVLAAKPARALVAENQAAAKSIRREHRKAGKAAAQRVWAETYGVLVRHPGVVGHGWTKTGVSARKGGRSSSAELSASKPIDPRKVKVDSNGDGSEP